MKEKKSLMILKIIKIAGEIIKEIKAINNNKGVSENIKNLIF